MFVLKKAMVGIVGVILLLGVGVVIFYYLFVWSNTNFSMYLVENEVNGNVGDLEIIGIKSAGNFGSILGVKNKGTVSHKISSVKINNITCGVGNSKIVGNVNNLEIDCDVSKFENYDVEIFTDKGIYSGVATVWDESEKELVLPFRGKFDFGNICLNSTRVYGMNYTNNSHAEVAGSDKYYYSLCVAHNNFVLGTDCFGNYIRLFYLAGETNSPIYFDNTSVAPEPYEGYYDWKDVCLSSNMGDFTILYQKDRPLRKEGYFICLGSYIRDDFNGGVIGGCSMYDDKIWVALG